MNCEFEQTVSSGPCVSVAIPTRDRLPLLREAVASVLAQTFTKWELIVVDDGSTDETWAWLNSLKDKRVRLLRNDTPMERSIARNHALDIARAPYILFLDDDDRLTPAALDHLTAGAVEAPEAVAIIGSRLLFDSFGNRRAVWHPRHAHNRWLWKEVIAGWSAQVGTTLYKRDVVKAIGGWNDILYCAEDQDMLLRASTQGPARLIPALVLEQRVHLTRRRTNNCIRNERALREHFLAWRSGQFRDPERRLLRCWEAVRAGDRALAAHRYRRALLCYLTAARLCPALVHSPLFGRRLAAQTMKALVGSCLGPRGSSMARALKVRWRLMLKRAPGEYCRHQQSTERFRAKQHGT
jgi:glycosyltransferase involved in cell wall biosynthesis